MPGIYSVLVAAMASFASFLTLVIPASGCGGEATHDHPRPPERADGSADDAYCPGPEITNCPETSGGPAMVVIDHCYCIDSTEVTRDQYADWLTTAPSDADQPPECSWNTGEDAFAPRCGWSPDEPGDLPVACIDWCDAYAFCKGVGKRLCGRIGGGPNDFSDSMHQDVSQWYNACSANGHNTWPYGCEYDSLACNGENGKSTAAVATFPRCHSSVVGYEGVYDMSGNVWEWEDSCDGTAGRADHCHIRGGAAGLGQLGLTCWYDYSGQDREARWALLGFRCCS